MIEVLIVVACAAPFLYAFARLIHARERERHQYDGMRLGSSTSGDVHEVFDPPFWRLDRHIKRMSAHGEVDFMRTDEMGKARLVRLRTRIVENPSDICPLCKRPYRGQS